MANNVIKSNARRIFLKSTKEWVAVSEEIYRERTRYCDACRKRAQFHGQCSCPKHKFWLCDGDCFNCEFRCSGDMLSLDFIGEDEKGNICPLLNSIPDPAPTLEDAVADKLLLEQLIQRLCELDPQAALIIKLLSQGASDRTIAEKLGRPQRSFARQMQHYRSELRKVRGY